MFTSDERWDIVHRSWTIKRIHGYQVFEFRRLELTQRLLHTFRLKLECRSCVTFAIQVECLLVIKWDMIDIDINPSRMLDVCNSFFDNRKRFESEEVHLDQSGFLNHTSLILS